MKSLSNGHGKDFVGRNVSSSCHVYKLVIHESPQKTKLEIPKGYVIHGLKSFAEEPGFGMGQYCAYLSIESHGENKIVFQNNSSKNIQVGPQIKLWKVRQAKFTLISSREIMKVCVVLAFKKPDSRKPALSLKSLPCLEAGSCIVGRTWTGDC